MGQTHERIGSISNMKTLRSLGSEPGFLWRTGPVIKRFRLAFCTARFYLIHTYLSNLVIIRTPTVQRLLKVKRRVHVLRRNILRLFACILRLRNRVHPALSILATDKVNEGEHVSVLMEGVWSGDGNRKLGGGRSFHKMDSHNNGVTEGIGRPVAKRNVG